MTGVVLESIFSGMGCRSNMGHQIENVSLSDSRLFTCPGTGSDHFSSILLCLSGTAVYGDGRPPNHIQHTQPGYNAAGENVRRNLHNAGVKDNSWGNPTQASSWTTKTHAAVKGQSESISSFGGQTAQRCISPDTVTWQEERSTKTASTNGHMTLLKGTRWYKSVAPGG